MHKKWSFPWRLSLVNVSKSAENCRVVPIYWRYLQWKTSFPVQWRASILRCLTEFSMHLWYGFSQLKSTKILRVLRTKQITIVFDYFRIKFEVLESILIPPPPPSPGRVDKKIIKNDTGWRGTAKKVMGLTQSFSVLIFLATDFALLYLMRLWSEADLGLLQHPRWRSFW